MRKKRRGDVFSVTMEKSDESEMKKKNKREKINMTSNT